MARKITRLSRWRAGSMIGAPLILPFSLAKAMTEPAEGDGADGDAKAHFDQALGMHRAGHADAEGFRRIEAPRPPSDTAARPTRL